MLTTLLLAAAFVLAMSLLISSVSAFVDLRDADRTAYLYGHNKPHLTWLSNVGSFYAVTVIFGAVIPAVSGWGWVPVYGVLLGIFAGYASLGGCLNRISRRLRSEHRDNEGTILPKTIPDLLEGNDRRTLARVQVMFFLGMVVLELGLARMALSTLLDQSPAPVYAGVLIIGAMCAMYTGLGGFLGVLRTDLFQAAILGSACVISLGTYRHSLFPILETTARLEYVFIDDWPLFIGSLATVFAFHFGMPDLWLRNFGTLDSRAGRVDLRPLRWAGITLVFAIVPPVFVGLSQLSAAGGLVRSVELSTSLEILRGNLSAVTSAPTLIWWLAGAFVCVLVTTTDTMLIGISQHLDAAWDWPKRWNIQAVPVGAMAVCGVSSAFIGPTLFWPLGAAIFVLLFGNAGIVAACASSRTAGALAGRSLGLYYSLAGIANAAFFTAYWGSVGSRLHIMGLVDAALASLVLVVVPIARGIGRRL